jgi:ABC-type uncharacterized transport system permease subunit
MQSTDKRPGTESFLHNKTFQVVIRYILMILLAFLLFALILLAMGKDPIRSYHDLLKATFGSLHGFSEVLVAMTPIVLTALAVALPARIGMINVGGEGQMFLGAIFATLAALTLSDLPRGILIPIMMILGMIGGALWAFLPAYLKSIGLINETIASLLMNSIAPKIAGLLVYGYWHSPRETNMTPSFTSAARLPTFFGTRVDLGFIFGLVLLAGFWFVMKYTRWGLEMRAIGGNFQAAKRNGIPNSAYMIIIFCIGGAIAGLAGMQQVSGFYGLLIPNFSPGYGYMGFLISWLAGGDPLGILIMAFVVSIIFTGGNMLQITISLPYAAINLLLAFTLFIVLARPSLPKLRKGGAL